MSMCARLYFEEDSRAHKSKRYINLKMLDASHRSSRGVLCIPSTAGVETLGRCRIRLEMISSSSSSSVIHEQRFSGAKRPRLREMG
jgi:hypothetical protein